jgi:hypothetical protein
MPSKRRAETYTALRFMRVAMKKIGSESNCADIRKPARKDVWQAQTN